jgi:hypothetical protein
VEKKILFTRLHCNANPIYVLPEKKLRGLSPNFHTHVSVSHLYIPRISPHIFLQQNRQTDFGNIYIAHRHMNVELETAARNSFSGNICFNFLVLCLCSVLVTILIGVVLLFDSLPTTNQHFSVNFCVFTSLVLSLRSWSSKWGWFVMGRPVHSFTPAISCMLPLMASC